MNIVEAVTQQQLKDLLATEFANALAQGDVTIPVPGTGKGSSLGAAFNAVALLALNGLANLVGIEQVARLATSTGADVDSFCAPWGVSRLQASAASGEVTFATASIATQNILVPVGTIVQTSGGLQFAVVADTSMGSAYDADLDAYVLVAGTTTVSALVQCLALGTVGNVAATAINSLYGGNGPVPAIATVSNPADFDNGVDFEGDVAYKLRFTATVSGSRAGTRTAIAGAIMGVEADLTYSIGDRMNVDGTNTPPSTTTTSALAIPTAGTTADFPVASLTAIPPLAYVTVADGTRAFYGQITAVGTNLTIKNIATLAGSGTMGSGATILFAGPQAYFTAVVNRLGQAGGPPTALLSAVASAIDDVQPAGSLRNVVAPTLIPVAVVATLYVPASFDANAVETAALTATTDYLNNIGLDPAGGTTDASFGKAYATLFGVSGVANVTGLTLNAGTSDVTAGFAQQLVAGTVTFTIVVV